MSSSNSNNLDLSKIDSDDVEQLAQQINLFYSNDTPVKTQLIRQWERNHTMLDGKQWLQFDGTSASGTQWNSITVSKNNEYIPRPVTNLLFDCYQTLKSYLIKNKPRSKVFPNSPLNYSDRISAQIATLCLEANWARLKEQYNYEAAAASLIVYGTVFKKSYWDTSSISLVKVPKMTQTPAIDLNTGMPTGAMNEIQETDPVTGDLLFDELPLGEVNTTVLDPHLITIDPLANQLHQARWIMECSVQTVDWVKETYGKQDNPNAANIDEIEPEKDLNPSLRKWYGLRNSSGVKENSLASGAAGTADAMVENSVILKEVYEQPSSQNPKGRLIVVAGDKVVFVGESPYEGPELGDWHPYSECRWEIMPGRFHGKGPLDAAVEIQKRLNSIDSIISLTRKTSAVPQKLIPTTCGVTPGSWTGRPNQEIYYRPDGTGAKPETIPPAGVDASIFQERAQCVSDLKEITGAIDILRGDNPKGVEAASALSLLYEVGTGKLYPILDRWKCFVENDQKKQLKIIQKFYKEPRPEFIRLLKSKNQDLAESEINQFIGKDLNYNCNVVIEAGSNIPKLEAAKQSLLMQLAQLGMLNLADPSNRVQFQQDMGILGYDADVEPDRKRAMFENSVLDNTDHTPNNKPIVLAIDNHALHKLEHTNRMKSPTFMACTASVQQAYMAHIAEHDQFEAMAAQAQMHQQLAMGAPPPGPNGPPETQAPPKGVAGKQHGPSKEMKNIVNGGPDVMNVATLGAQG